MVDVSSITLLYLCKFSGNDEEGSVKEKEAQKYCQKTRRKKYARLTGEKMSEQ